MFGVETKTCENNFLFIRGIGVVEVMTGNEKLRTQSVFYTPELDRNILSLDQLIIQGYTDKFTGDKCRIYPTFSVPVINRKNEIFGLTREDEIGIREKESIIKSEPDHEAFKTDYLNQYFENLNLPSNEPDWNVLILQAMSFKEFQDCKAILDMLEDNRYVSKYKFSLESKFDDMVDWFLKEKLEITTRPVAAYALDNRKVSMLELYMVAKREGGHRRVTENNMCGMWLPKIWALIIMTESL
ncbi:hypothetical protein Hdeb2414_s0065g00766301 [Helianthus debilis subsp. tardiflorus]